MQKNIIISIILSLIIISGTIYFVSKSDSNDLMSQVKNSEIISGIQYVTIIAKGGYSPRMSLIKPNIPTKLIIKTNGTYDCSASLTIKKINFQKILNSSGEEVIDLGILKPGEEINGICGMGMFSFNIISN